MTEVVAAVPSEVGHVEVVVAAAVMTGTAAAETDGTSYRRIKAGLIIQVF